VTLSEHYRKNLQLAVPVMIGQLGHITVGLADSIMIGRLGVGPLAASAFANSVFVIPMVFGMGVTFGLTPLIANADGQQDHRRSGSLFWHGLVLHGFTAVLLVLGLLALRPALPYMGQEAAVVELAGPYLSLLAASLFPLMFFFSTKQFAEGLSHTRFAMAASVLINLFNIFFNWLLIYGNWGLPALGLNGAGWATLLARLLMGAVMLFYVLRKWNLRALRPNRWLKERFGRLWQLGAPTGLQYIFEVSAFALAAVMTGWIGASALASHQIAISLAAISYMAASGLGAAATVRVGNQLGARQYRTMQQAGYTCLILTILLMSFSGVLFWLGKDLLPTFYTEDAEVIALASKLLVVAVFFQLFDGVQVSALGALRGMAETRIPTFITFFSYWMVGLSAAYYFGFFKHLGVIGIWYGLALGLIVASVLLFWRFYHQSQKLRYGHKS